MTPYSCLKQVNLIKIHVKFSENKSYITCTNILY